MMTSAQIRQSFLDFFKSKQHTIVPSSSLMPDSPNLLFTNAGMNQFVPIFLGQVKCPYSPGRAADTQKCIRAGGKHNDLDDVGLDTYHHTFFEMLGNWSFGDYFKKEAIEWAWELVVGIWKFPPQRLYATVYNPDKSKNDPSEFDQDAWNFWAEKFRAAGLDPAVHIVNGNKKDNFWMMGDTGPCGPCSELHVDLTPEDRTPELEKRGSGLVNKGDARCIEIWNLVFIQFNANPDGTFSPLPAKHVDTGMGFERVTSIIQGTKGFTDFAHAKISNYETDIFRPIFDALEKMSGKKYTSTLPGTAAAATSPDALPLKTTGECVGGIIEVDSSHPGGMQNAVIPPSGTGPEGEKGDFPTKGAFPAPSGAFSGENGKRPIPSGELPGKKGDVPISSGALPISSRERPAEKGEPPISPGELPISRSDVPNLSGERPGTSGEATQEAIDIAFRVIADHIRTLSFAIADGIQPGIKGRDGVLRSIQKRMVRYASTIGIKDELLNTTQDTLVETLAATMGDVFPNVRTQKEHIKKVLRGEADVFNRTLENGIDQFEFRIGETIRKHITWLQGSLNRRLCFTYRGGWIGSDGRLPGPETTIDLSNDVGNTLRSFGLPVPVFPGEFAFELSDTYGFPLDLTELMARERGLAVDKDGFNKLMDEQKKRSQAARVTQVIELSQIKTTTPTKFVGFDTLSTQAKVLEVVGVKDKTAVVLDTSTAYAEMGGQVGDTGELSGGGQLWRVVNTQKNGNTWLHFIQSPIPNPQSSILNSEDLPAIGADVELTVDKPRRDAIQRHHTVTHLLHWALHEVVSKEASQKGSFVGPDKLTFDFNAQPLTPQQVADIEKLVNERVLENAGVSWTEVPYADVKSRKDVMQFFGDKYGDTVRVVQVGGRAGELNGYSMELCGGTHTRATGEIGLFRIVGENAIAAGVRRIEAVAGLNAYEVANQQLQLIKSIAGKINSPVHELEKKVEALLAHQKELEKQLKAASQREAAGKAKDLVAKAKMINGIPALIENLGVADGDMLQSIADALKSYFHGVIVLAGHTMEAGAKQNTFVGGAVSLVASVSSEFTSKVQAGKIIQTIAPIVGGKGGGKPDNARGGGKDASKLDEALSKAKSLLE